MPSRSGDVIDGKYRLERTLGIGGMGIVFEAQHIELEVRRAIKIMQPAPVNSTGTDNVDPNAHVRFLREARAAARIVSEHVAHVYDVGVLESGERYMVIEYLSGTDLERLVRKRGPQSAEKSVAYVLQACSGIAEAHKLGIIHRDIKSSNLFLTENEVVKVIDWGLAKQTLNGETGITQANHVVGSLAYMSPEQLNGDEVDARTDMWSLGVVLYELVTGKLPFTGGTCGEVIHNILHKEPTATTSMPELSLALDAIVRRCMQKDRNLRYASVDALARDLRSVDLSRPSALDTLEMTTGETPSQASRSGTSTSERRSTKHEQETAVQRHRRDRITGSSQPTVGESKPSSGTKTPEGNRRTSGSRAALYALGAMALLALLAYAFSVPAQPLSPVAAAATSGTRLANDDDDDRVVPEARESAKRIEPTKGTEPARPDPPAREPQRQAAVPPPKPAAPLPAAPHGDVAARAVHAATRDRAARPELLSDRNPAPKVPPPAVALSGATDVGDGSDGSSIDKRPVARRRTAADMSSHHGHPDSDAIYKDR